MLDPFLSTSLPEEGQISPPQAPQSLEVLCAYFNTTTPSYQSSTSAGESHRHSTQLPHPERCLVQGTAHTQLQ
jgi:hypothetical protein